MAMLNQIQKADKTANALRQLRKELAEEGQRHQCAAITDYLLNTNGESLARLHDILMPEPRPLGELIAEEVAAGRMVG